jgi:hypothetical protein
LLPKGRLFGTVQAESLAKLLSYIEELKQSKTDVNSRLVGFIE